MKFLQLIWLPCLVLICSSSVSSISVMPFKIRSTPILIPKWFWFCWLESLRSNNWPLTLLCCMRLGSLKLAPINFWPNRWKNAWLSWGPIWFHLLNSTREAKSTWATSQQLEMNTATSMKPSWNGQWKAVSIRIQSLTTTRPSSSRFTREQSFDG